MTCAALSPTATQALARARTPHTSCRSSAHAHACAQALAFDYQTLKEPVSSEALDAHRKFANNFVHLVSLMHGVALATLRDDFDMENVMVRRRAYGHAAR